MALYEQINDAQVRSLRKEGYQGQLNEMLAAWLQAEGAVGDDLMRLWWSCFNIRSIPKNQHNQRLRAWYLLEEFPLPTLADAALAHWIKRALEP